MSFNAETLMEIVETLPIELKVKLVEDKTVNKDIIKDLSKDYEIEILSGDKTEKVQEVYNLEILLLYFVYIFVLLKMKI